MRSDLGKKRRMARLFAAGSGRSVVVPLDDALLAGPEGHLRDSAALVRAIADAGVNAIMGFSGIFERCFPEQAQFGCVLNLTASTTRAKHTRKVQVFTVPDALALGMDAVAVHVNISSRYESEMLKTLGRVGAECSAYGMPLVGIMYPRREVNGQDDNYEDLQQTNPDEYAALVRHATRVGVELGADIIKTQFTGSVASWASVIQVASGVPVLIAGGPRTTVQDMLTKARAAVIAGGAGVSFGRNVFLSDEPAGRVRALCAIVHENCSVEAALARI